MSANTSGIDLGAMKKTLITRIVIMKIANALSDLPSSAQINCIQEDPANAGKNVITAVLSDSKV
ncbi:hypothetical protein [Paraburkholderia caballeronis]|uniref:hypothetical protein n=1 Tax=Paraburkholderia caballeronis TaxID=416943 RepID=UPI001065C72F|nr:hypothetical protein [Paraburkholderia caballeronis]